MIVVGLSFQLFELISLSCRNTRCQGLQCCHQRDNGSRQTAQRLPTKTTKLRKILLSNNRSAQTAMICRYRQCTIAMTLSATRVNVPALSAIEGRSDPSLPKQARSESVQSGSSHPLQSWEHGLAAAATWHLFPPSILRGTGKVTSTFRPIGRALSVADHVSSTEGTSPLSVL